MAITALATQNTTIGPAQFADMTEVLTARFKVDGPTHLKPTVGSGGTVSVSSGAATAGGSRVRSTATETVTIPSVSSGQVWYSVCLRIDWSTSAVQLVAVRGSSSSVTINNSSSPNPSAVNRIPGVLYDALICNVLRTRTGIGALTDMRMYGGDGGPYIVSDGALSSPGSLDARPGTWIATDQSVFTKRLDTDGVWRVVGTQSNPWKMWTPTIRYHGMTPTNVGTGNGTVASLGTGGQASGRYRVVDGLLDGFVSVTTGAGANFGTGALTFDLPAACASWQPDTWSEGHIWFAKTTTLGDRDLDFQSQALIKSGWTRGQMFVPEKGSSSIMVPHISSNKGGPGEGLPFILGGWSTGSVYSFHIAYPVED